MIEFGGIKLDPIEIGSQGNAILGIRDSGKTYTAMLLAEGLFDAGIPFVAFDPIGVWRYLRVPGKGKGYPIVVAGGQEGDLPLTVQTAPMIVEAAMKEGVSLVIDLFHMDLSKTDWRRIVRESVKLLLHRNKDHGLRHIFLEEAAEFVPQKVNDWDVYAELEKLARMGGNSRLGYTLINQRSQEVNKAVLELCENLFLHRQKGKLSIENLKKWLDVAGASSSGIIASLPTLAQGECWAWLGGSDLPLHVRVPTKNSLHPDRRVMHGEIGVVKKAVSVDRFVGALQKALPQIEEEAKANDPKLLKARVAELERLIAGRAAAAASASTAPTWPDQRHEVAHLKADIEDAMTRGENAGYQRGLSAGVSIGITRCRSTIDALRVPDIIESLDDQIPAPKAGETRPPSPAGNTEQARPRPTPREPRPAPASAREASQRIGDASLSGPQRNLLSAMAWWKAMGHDEPTRVQLAAKAGWTPKGSNLRNRLTELSSAGLVEYPRTGLVRLTEAGVAAAPTPDTSKTLIDSIRAVLSGPQGGLFEALLAHGDTMSRVDLAKAVGWEPQGSNLRNRLAEMSALELVEYPARGEVRLQQWVVG